MAYDEYSYDPRYLGTLAPSPRGSYFAASRYRDLSPTQLKRAKANLDKVYRQDVVYNRVANPNYQTVQDTGATLTAPFGSGRATPATVQRYAEQYGTKDASGLVTVQTPSGGFITYKPSGRKLSGGVPGGGAVPASYQTHFPAATAYQLGFSGEPSAIAAKPVSERTGYEKSYLQGYNVPGVQLPEPSSLGYYAGRALSTGVGAVNRLAMNVGSKIGGWFNPAQPNPNTDYYAYNPSPVPVKPRRYFDF